MFIWIIRPRLPFILNLFRVTKKQSHASKMWPFIKKWIICLVFKDGLQDVPKTFKHFSLIKFHLYLYIYSVLSAKELKLKFANEEEEGFDVRWFVASILVGRHGFLREVQVRTDQPMNVWSLFPPTRSRQSTHKNKRNQ